MAIERTFLCSQCHKVATEMQSVHRETDICFGCRQADRECGKQKELRKLREGKTLEERIAQIEEELWEQRNKEHWDGRLG